MPKTTKKLPSAPSSKRPAKSRNSSKPAAKNNTRGHYVYYFGNGKADGNGTMKALLGGKGANLAEMTRIGLPVPPGFTITTEVCTYFYANKRTYPGTAGADGGRRRATWRKSWGQSSATPKPCRSCVAVRSGARDSMPGMMDTILNLGFNDQTVIALAHATEQ